MGDCSLMGLSSLTEMSRPALALCASSAGPSSCGVPEPQLGFRRRRREGRRSCAEVPMNPEGNGRGWSQRLDPPAARASASRRRSGCRAWGSRPAARRRCLGREQGSDRERGAAASRRSPAAAPCSGRTDAATLRRGADGGKRREMPRRKEQLQGGRQRRSRAAVAMAGEAGCGGPQ